MNKFIKDQIGLLKPSATLAINEESNRLKKLGKKVYKFGFGQSPFPIPESIVLELKNNASKNKTIKTITIPCTATRIPCSILSFIIIFISYSYPIR